MKTHAISSALALFILAGCATTASIPTSAERQTRLENVLPPRFDAQRMLADSPTSLVAEDAKLNWWEGFSDDHLNLLVTTSLENSPSLAASHANFRAAQADFEAVMASKGVRIDVNGQVNTRRTSGDSNTGSNGNSSRSGRSIALGLALPLDTNGQLASQIGAAHASMLIAQSQLYAELLSTSANVARSYLDYQGNFTQLRLLEESVRLQEETLRIVKVRFETGLSPELDVQRARTSVENLKASLAPLRQAMAESRMRLASLTGKSSSFVDTQLSGSGALPTYQARIPQAIPIDVAQSRPDVQAAWAEVLRRAYEVGVAKSAFYPAVDISASITLGIQSISGAGTVDTLSKLIALAFNQMIFDSGLTEAQVAAAKARADAALALFDQALLNAVEGVENQLNRIGNSRQRQIALGNSAAASRRTFEQANALYQLGLVSFLDVVDAQRVLANAQQALAKEQTDYAKHIIGLFEVLGAINQPSP